MNVTYDKAKLLDENSSLLNQTGHLLESGYHTKPVKSFNKQSIGKTFLGIAEQSFLRYKQLEHHWFQNSEYMIYFYFTNLNGLFNSATLEIYNSETNELQKDNKWVYLPWNVFDLNDDTMHFNTTMAFEKGGLEISYNDKEHTDHFERNFKIKSYNLNFQGDFVVKKYKSHDGHFFAEQILEEDERFWHAGHREYGMEISGKGELGNEEINFDKNSSAMLDVRRGVLAYFIYPYIDIYCFLFKN